MTCDKSFFPQICLCLFFYETNRKLVNKKGRQLNSHLDALDLGNVSSHGGENSLPGFQVVNGNTLGVKVLNEQIGEVLR